MAISFINAWENNASSSTGSLAVTVATTAGDCIIVYVAYDNGATVTPTSITDNASPPNLYTLQTNAQGNNNLSLWSTPANGTRAATTVTVSFPDGGSTVKKTVVVVSYRGALSLGLTGSHVTATGTSESVSVTTQDANNWVAACFWDQDGSDGTIIWTQATGTNRGKYQVQSNQNMCFSDNTSVAAGSVTNHTTMSGSLQPSGSAVVALELRTVLALVTSADDDLQIDAWGKGGKGARPIVIFDHSQQDEQAIIIGQLLRPPFAFADDGELNKFDVTWRQNFQTDEETHRALSPPPPVTFTDDGEYKFDATLRPIAYDHIQDTDEPGSLSRPPAAIQDEISEHWLDWRVPGVEDDASARPITPAPTINIGSDDADAFFKSLDRVSLYDHTSDTDEPGGLSVPPFAIRDEVSERFTDSRQIWHDDTETQSEPAPLPPTVFTDDGELKIDASWKVQQHDDIDTLRTFPPTPPVAIDQDTEHAKWLGWLTPALEDDWTTLPPRPPFSVQDGEEPKFVGYWNVYDHAQDTDLPGFVGAPPFSEPGWFSLAEEEITVGDVMDFGFATAPTVIDEEFIQVSPVTISNFSQEDIDAPFPTTPPPVVDIGLDDIEAHSEQSKWAGTSAIQHDDTETQSVRTPTPPVTQDGDDQTMAQQVRALPPEDPDSFYPPIPIVVVPTFGSDDVPSMWTGWSQPYQSEEETQRLSPPTPPTAADADISRVIEARSVQPEEADNAYPVVPPLIAPNVGLDDIEALFKDAAWPLVFHEDDQSNLAPFPPRAIDQDTESAMWSGWRSPAIEDDLTTEAPQPPLASDADLQTWAAWESPAIEDDRSMPAPTPPQAIDQDTEQSKWVGWEQVFQTDEETQRGNPPTPPWADEDQQSFAHEFRTVFLEDELATFAVYPASAMCATRASLVVQMLASASVAAQLTAAASTIAQVKVTGMVSGQTSASGEVITEMNGGSEEGCK